MQNIADAISLAFAVSASSQVTKAEPWDQNMHVEQIYGAQQHGLGPVKITSRSSTKTALLVDLLTSVKTDYC